MNRQSPSWILASRRGGPPARLPRGRGFALVVTLSLLILLTVVAVGLLTVSSISLRSSNQGEAMASARANARLALMLAIGQLQKEAGPDQRVSARAEILDGGTPANVRNPYWTGVWKTYNPAAGANRLLDTGTNPTLRKWSTDPNGTGSVDSKNPNMTWLVSNPTPATQLDPKAALTGNTAVLASSLGAGGTSVKVPMVPIPSTGAGSSPGQYAYWVSDEGIKAKVNLNDPTYGVTQSGSYVKNQQHFLAPQAVPVNNGLLGPDNTTDVRDQADLAKVTGLQSMGFVTGINPASLAGAKTALYSPDATTYSFGVLADARKGGLKTDLSTLFETPADYRLFLASQQSTAPSAYLDSGPGDAKLFVVEGNATTSGNNTSTFAFGTRWQQLYNYYSLYKNLIPANGLNSTACSFSGLNSFSPGNPGSTSPAMDMRAYNYSSIPTNSGAAADCPGESYMPRLVGIGLYFYLSSEQVPTPASAPPPGAGQHYYKMRLYVEPRVVYYNPYNVTLSSPKVSATASRFQLRWGGNLLSMSAGGLAVKVNGASVTGSYTNAAGQTNPCSILATGAWTATKDSAGNIIDYGPEMKSLAIITDNNPTTTDMAMSPGQIRVFGLGGLKPVPMGNAHVFDGNTVNGTSFIGGNVGQSQWCYLPDYGAVPKGTTASSWLKLANDNDPVTISMPSLTFRSNDGRYNTSVPGASSWPKTISSGSLQLGRFFHESSTQPATTVSMGPIANIQSTSQGFPFGYFVLRSRGIQQSTTSTTASAAASMPVFSSCDANISPFPARYDSPSVDIDFQLAAQNPKSSTDIQLTGSSPVLTTFWGNNDVARNAGDNNGFVMADIPRQPMLSLGQFMHMPLRNSMATGSGYEVDEGCQTLSMGGSLCNPFMPLNYSYNTTTGQSGQPNQTFVMDDNYMINDALFDPYFFSTVPPAVPDASYSAVLPSAAGSLTESGIRNNSVTLPNSRMKFYTKDGEPPQCTDPARANYLPHYRKCAANLLLDGAFNVNSTSVNAWAALLSSLSGNAMSFLSNGSYRPVDLRGRTPVPRFASIVSADGSDPVNTPFGGVHALTKDQVNSLAAEIVRQVKTRGPFLGMADFINRRLDATTGLGYKGALQAAIDNTTINTTNLPSLATPPASGQVVDGMNIKGPLLVSGQRMTYPKQMPANTAVGIPGWLMQQDLVQAFSPVMTARSDTFVIRCYGECSNPSGGAPLAKAWCEAVVQRVPDFIDQNDPALPPLGDATAPFDYKTSTQQVNTTNWNFGRRFKVTSFRWLSPNEI